ncbi:MAG TPA: ABC transporter permease [Methylomirabilota bacterium]|nr:ABC transporter permease [Methylomirabilota bacterium]
MSRATAGAARRGIGPEARWLTAAVEWQSRAVVGRHLRVYLHNWHTAFLPPLGEPVTMLLAFGLGLGGYVADLDWHGRAVPYLTYVAPGLLAYAAFMTAVFQALYAAFIRMRYQRTWEGQLTTQVELRHVVWGEVLWAALLATIYVAIVALVLTGFQVAGVVEVEVAWLPAALPVAFVAGCAFAALGLCSTALVPTIDHMNIPVFLIVIPLGLLSGTYFPITHPLALALSSVNPLYHLAQTYRGLLLGGPIAGHLGSLIGLTVLIVLAVVPVDLHLLRRRVLGD